MDGFIRDFVPLVGVERACRAFGTPARSYRYRRRRRRSATGVGAAAEQRVTGTGDAGTSPAVTDAMTEAAPEAVAAVWLPPLHPAALTTDERYDVLTMLRSDRFVDLSPHQVFMTLLDEGTYVCSVRSMYRLLEDHGLSRDRRRGGHQGVVLVGTYADSHLSLLGLL